MLPVREAQDCQSCQRRLAFLETGAFDDEQGNTVVTSRQGSAAGIQAHTEHCLWWPGLGTHSICCSHHLCLVHQLQYLGKMRTHPIPVACHPMFVI